VLTVPTTGLSPGACSAHSTNYRPVSRSVVYPQYQLQACLQERVVLTVLTDIHNILHHYVGSVLGPHCPCLQARKPALHHCTDTECISGSCGTVWSHGGAQHLWLQFSNRRRDRNWPVFDIVRTGAAPVPCHNMQ
jgi:hypothetical protein